MADGDPGMPPDTPRVDRRSPRPGRPPVHGLKALRRAVTELTTRRLDGRSAVAVAVRRWKEDVRRDLGGDLTRAQETILEGAAQKWVIREALADYIARQAGLVSKKRAVAPVVATHLQVSESLNRDLERLGLERRAKPVPSLAEYLAKKDAEPKMDIPPRPPSESRPSSTILKPFSSSSSEEMPKKDAPQVSRGETEDDGS